ncbi:MAG TPA: hypothetical protein VFY23_09375 [Candidatus Limnocylindrales bacterium]|nr:hypothetical protein [Candidatus Limnocylindrales bacterium]
MELYPVVVTGHVFFVIVALGAHGASAVAMVAVRREPDRARLAAILDLSVRAFSVASVTLAAAVVLGIAATVMGNHGGRAWVWLSVAVLVALMVVMGPVAGAPMNRVRRALGLRFERNGPGADPDHEPLSDVDLVAARAALRPGLVASLGLAGTFLLVWLMEAKPW